MAGAKVDIRMTTDCPICLEPTGDSGSQQNDPNPRVLLDPCCHAFCLTCIRKWQWELAERQRFSSTITSDKNGLQKSCPVCRTRYNGFFTVEKRARNSLCQKLLLSNRCFFHAEAYPLCRQYPRKRRFCGAPQGTATAPLESSLVRCDPFLPEWMCLSLMLDVSLFLLAFAVILYSFYHELSDLSKM